MTPRQRQHEAIVARLIRESITKCPVRHCPLQQSRAVIWRPDNMLGGFIIGRRCGRHAVELAREWNEEGDSVYLIKVES